MNIFRKALSLVFALLLVCSVSVGAFAIVDTEPVVIGDNPAGGTVSEVGSDELMNENLGTVFTNNGTIVSNKDHIVSNNGTVSENTGDALITSVGGDGTVAENSALINVNEGTVVKNTADGSVSRNYGTVGENGGIVELNYGIVNNSSGSVSENYGTETLADGTVRVGVTVRETDGEGGSELTQFVKDAPTPLEPLFSREGFIIGGYTEGAGGDVIPSAEYTASAPGTITLVWSEAAPAAPAGDEDYTVPALVRPYEIKKAENGTFSFRYNCNGWEKVEDESQLEPAVSLDDRELDSGSWKLSFDKDSKNFDLELAQELLSSLETGSHTLKITILGRDYTLKLAA